MRGTLFVGRWFPRQAPQHSPVKAQLREKITMSMYVGEALVGEGNEIAHIDLLIGDKDGPVGVAFANALANQSAGPQQPAGRARRRTWPSSRPPC